jgi:hypothetical protein
MISLDKVAAKSSATSFQFPRTGVRLLPIVPGFARPLEIRDGDGIFESRQRWLTRLVQIH